MNRRLTLKSICCAVGALLPWKSNGDVLGLDDYEPIPAKNHGTYWFHYDEETRMFTSGVIVNGKKKTVCVTKASAVLDQPE